MTIKVTPQLIAELRKRDRQRAYPVILKWDRNQPRGPKGSPTGGRWVKDVSQGGGDTGDPQGSGLLVPPGMQRLQGEASYADIMSAPTGTGFHNRPQGAGVRTAALLARAKEKEAARDAKGETEYTAALRDGTIHDFDTTNRGGSNHVYKVEMEAPDGKLVEAMYKPRAGEMWGRGFTNHSIDDHITNLALSLGEREEMAYEVDRALALGLVPETHFRDTLEGGDDPEAGDLPGGSNSGGGYDSSELQQMYDEYRQNRLESGGVMDAVGDEMGRLYAEAETEHVEALKNRAEEMADIWNEAIKDFPDGPYGDPEVLRAHPVLPLGSAGPFQRKDALPPLDPLDVLVEADVDVTAPLSEVEKERVEAVLRKRLEEGYDELGDVDDDAAKEHLDRDRWLEDHADTENRLYDQNIQSFDAWRQDHGYGGGGGGGGRYGRFNAGKEGGSLQFYVENLDGGTLSHEDGTKAAVLDYIIGTMDRHGENLGFDGDDFVAIDNGYSMPASDTPDGFTFRSRAVAQWMGDARHRRVTADVRLPIRERLEQTNWQALIDRHPNMSREERSAFLGRIENMKDALSSDEGLATLWHGQDLMRY